MADTKLTKKQRKAAEFRSKEKKDDKGDTAKGEPQNNGRGEEEANQLSQLDKGKGKAEEKERTGIVANVKTKKRKLPREENDVGMKKRFDEETGKMVESKTSAVETAANTHSTEKESGKRFILFIGNMSFKTTSPEIAKHFADHCGETPNVRLLTKRITPASSSSTATLSKSKQKSIAKGKASDPRTATEQSKGCAFVEFESREALQKALQFHHTTLHGRTINVELTAGGGGKGAERKEKIQRKNKELDEERKKLHEKYVKGKEGEKKADGHWAAEPTKPHWGPNAQKAKSPSSSKKVPKWAASGANAVRLNG